MNAAPIHTPIDVGRVEPCGWRAPGDGGEWAPGSQGAVVVCASVVMDAFVGLCIRADATLVITTQLRPPIHGRTQQARRVAMPGSPKFSRAWAVWLVVLTSVVPVATSGCTGGPIAGSEQHGLVLPTWQRDGYDGSQADAYIEQVAATGARWIQVTPTWYETSTAASEIQPTDSSASDRGVDRMIHLAHNHGLKVLLKPHVDMTGINGRTGFAPSDRAAWFTSYRAFITHFARIADRQHADEFAVGTELAGVSDDRAPWLKIIDVVRKEYPGPLVYAAGNQELNSVAFWDAVDLIGVDAYWSLSRTPTTDPAVLERSWKPIVRRLAALSARLHRRVLFTEAGYTSQRGTVTSPGTYQISGQPDQAEQAAAYQALLATFTGRSWWAGVFWWVWGVLPDEDPSSRALGYAVDDKQAANVLGKWW